MSDDAMMHGRAPWLGPDDLDVPARALYDEIVGGPRRNLASLSLATPEGRLHGPFNAMLLNPAVGMALQRLGTALRAKLTLTEREREVTILALAAARRSEFEWYAHANIGARVGLTEAELATLVRGRCPDTCTQTERTCHEIAVALITARDLDDAQFAAAEATLGLAGLTDVISLVGYYDHLALALQVWRVPLPDDVPPVFGEPTG